MAQSTTKKECYALIQQVTLKQSTRCRVMSCGKPSTVGHHIFPRNRMGTAFNPLAVLALCNDHHRFAHEHPKSFRAIAELIVGSQYEALNSLSRMTVQFRADDYLRIKNELLTALAKEVQCTR
jgi:hypothetical protein